jgi:ATP-binding cassette, subfamily C (CFTR/MRP), member 1
MFTGTLRENLDPFGDHDDGELCRLIDEVGLGHQAAACGGLDGYVAGSGSDRWSVGQMQLVCLIRAALNKVPIVCMDEATAALDPHTEAHVLEVAERLFKTRTVLTIAHRLDAVISADTVVVMEQGKVAETGAPATLLNDRYSWFSKLVDMSGPAEAAHLRQTAARHFAAMSGNVPGTLTL